MSERSDTKIERLLGQILQAVQRTGGGGFTQTPQGRPEDRADGGTSPQGHAPASQRKRKHYDLKHKIYGNGGLPEREIDTTNRALKDLNKALESSQKHLDGMDVGTVEYVKSLDEMIKGQNQFVSAIAEHEHLGNKALQDLTTVINQNVEGQSLFGRSLKDMNLNMQKIDDLFKDSGKYLQEYNEVLTEAGEQTLSEVKNKKQLNRLITILGKNVKFSGDIEKQISEGKLSEAAKLIDAEAKNSKSYRDQVMKTTNQFVDLHGTLQKTSKGMDWLGKQFGLMDLGSVAGGMAAVAAGVKQIYNQYRGVTSAGLGNAFGKLQVEGLKLGVNFEELTKIISGNKQLVSKMGLNGFTDMLDHSQDSLMTLGLSTTEAAKATAGMANVAQEAGIDATKDQKGLADSIADQTKAFSKLRAVTGITAEEFNAQNKALLDSTDMQEYMLKLSQSERINKFKDMTLERQHYALLGLTNEQTQKALQVQAANQNDPMLKRFEDSAKLMQGAMLSGLSQPEAQTLQQGHFKGMENMGPEEKAQYLALVQKANKNAATMSNAQMMGPDGKMMPDIAQQQRADMARAGLGAIRESEIGKDLELSKNKEITPGQEKTQEELGKLSPAMMEFSKTLDKVGNLLENPLLKILLGIGSIAVGVYGIWATLGGKGLLSILKKGGGPGAVEDMLSQMEKKPGGVPGGEPTPGGPTKPGGAPAAEGVPPWNPKSKTPPLAGEQFATKPPEAIPGAPKATSAAELAVEPMAKPGGIPGTAAAAVEEAAGSKGWWGATKGLTKGFAKKLPYVGAALAAADIGSVYLDSNKSMEDKNAAAVGKASRIGTILAAGGTGAAVGGAAGAAAFGVGSIPGAAVGFLVGAGSAMLADMTVGDKIEKLATDAAGNLLKKDKGKTLSDLIVPSAGAATMPTYPTVPAPSQPVQGQMTAPQTDMSQVPKALRKKVGLINAPSQYDDLFAAAGAKYGIDPRILKQIGVQESGLQNIQGAVNANGTVDQGVMQLNNKYNASRGVTNAFDPTQNIDAAAKLFAANRKKAGGDLWTTFRMYNGSGKAAEDYADRAMNLYSAANQAGAPTTTAKASPATLPVPGAPIINAQTNPSFTEKALSAIIPQANAAESTAPVKKTTKPKEPSWLDNLQSTMSNPLMALSTIIPGGSMLPALNMGLPGGIPSWMNPFSTTQSATGLIPGVKTPTNVAQQIATAQQLTTPGITPGTTSPMTSVTGTPQVAAWQVQAAQMTAGTVQITTSNPVNTLNNMSSLPTTLPNSTPPDLDYGYSSIGSQASYLNDFLAKNNNVSTPAKSTWGDHPFAVKDNIMDVSGAQAQQASMMAGTKSITDIYSKMDEISSTLSSMLSIDQYRMDVARRSSFGGAGTWTKPEAISG